MYHFVNTIFFVPRWGNEMFRGVGGMPPGKKNIAIPSGNRAKSRDLPYPVYAGIQRHHCR